MSENQKRLRLYGKQATKEQIAQEVARLLLLGEGARRIQKTLDFNSKQTVYNYKELAIELKLLEIDQDGKAKLPKKSEEESFAEFTEKNPFTKQPLIEEWVQNLLLRKQGEPIKSMKNYITTLKGICNTLKINPSALLQDAKTSEKYFENFLVLYKKGEAKITYKVPADKVDMKNVTYAWNKGLRDFMRFHGITYMRGVQGIMSQKVPNHGNYADIRLTNDEIEELKKYLIGKYGIDSDEFRVIAIAIESCSRLEALLGMKLDYERYENPETQSVTYLMTAYESKTKQIKGGKWTKYIQWEETQKSIDNLRDAGGYKIYSSTLSSSKFKAHMQSVIYDLFIHLKKIPNMEELLAKRKEGWKKVGNYYYEKPFHVFRHIGAHYWLEVTDYDYVAVAKIGGWHTVDELIKSYGEMPASRLLAAIDKGLQRKKEEAKN